MSKNIRVARLIDDSNFRLVLNVGEVDGVKTGDKFLVYGMDRDQHIIDPETGEDLGIFELVKGRGKVIDVQEKYCIIESIVSRKYKNTNIPINEMSLWDKPAKNINLPFDDPKAGDYAKKIN